MGDYQFSSIKMLLKIVDMVGFLAIQGVAYYHQNFTITLVD